MLSGPCACRHSLSVCLYPAMQTSADSVSGASHSGRHAVLHDFCMVIPFSAIVAAAGLATLLLGSRQVGLQLLVAGAVLGAAAASSLSRWKKGLSSRSVTSLAAGGCRTSKLLPLMCTCCNFFV